MDDEQLVIFVIETYHFEILLIATLWIQFGPLKKWIQELKWSLYQRCTIIRISVIWDSNFDFINSCSKWYQYVRFLSVLVCTPNWMFERIILPYAPNQKRTIQLLERKHWYKNENNEENRTWAYTLNQEFHTSIGFIRRLWLSNLLMQNIYMIAVWHFSLYMSVAVDVDSPATVSIIIRQHEKTVIKEQIRRTNRILSAT